jgi:hypothetical protein
VTGGNAGFEDGAKVDLGETFWMRLGVAAPRRVPAGAVDHPEEVEPT